MSNASQIKDYIHRDGSGVVLEMKPVMLDVWDIWMYK